MLPQNKNMRFLIKLLVSGGLLAAVFSMIPVTQVVDALLRANWSIVVLSFFVIASTHYLNSAQMYLITRHQGISLSVNQIFIVNLITKFYGLFLPGIIAGGAIRWYHFSRADRKPAQPPDRPANMVKEALRQAVPEEPSGSDGGGLRA